MYWGEKKAEHSLLPAVDQCIVSMPARQLQEERNVAVREAGVASRRRLSRFARRTLPRLLRWVQVNPNPLAIRAKLKGDLTTWLAMRRKDNKGASRTSSLCLPSTTFLGSHSTLAEGVCYSPLLSLAWTTPTPTSTSADSTSPSTISNPSRRISSPSSYSTHTQRRSIEAGLSCSGVELGSGTALQGKRSA